MAVVHELIVVGGGPAGYVAAETAGRSGMPVLLLERGPPGGVCLNSGCVPTKTLLHSAKLYRHAIEAGAYGIRTGEIALDYPVLAARTAKVRDALRQGVVAMLRKAKVAVEAGEARLAGRDKGLFVVEAGGKRHVARRLLLCVGSKAAVPPIPGAAGNPRAVTSDGMLDRGRLADSLIVVGGGVIGLEFAAFHALLGVPVTVLEMAPALGGPGLDPDAAKILRRRLEDLGTQFHLKARVERVDGGTAHFRDAAGVGHAATAEAILLATGRLPATDGLGAETLGLDMAKGAIQVDAHAQTSVPGVYAAGDCTGRTQLAHFASRQGRVAVSHMLGKPQSMREEAIPSVLYTDPEIATVGLTEAKAREAGLPVTVRKLPVAASGRFVAENNGGTGLVKAVFSDPGGQVLGMTVAGPYASEMIGAACLMREMELRAADVAEVVFPHPTVSELMRDLMG